MRFAPLRWIRTAAAGALIATNTVVHAAPILTLAAAKLLLPFKRARAAMSRWMPAFGESWIAVNSWAIARFTPTRWVVTGDAALSHARRYLVLSNHQSWVDIPVLQKVLNRRIPFQRFFLKDSLKWVPVLGLAWWALDFPFMKRASKSEIQKRPELARRDLETARAACAKFREIPVSVMNSMGEMLDGIVDVTIVYPQGRPTIIDLFAGKVREIRVDLRLRPVPAELVGGDYENDRAYRARFQQWLNGLWAEKDAKIDELLAQPA